ncbi:MAG: hypothetical protein H7326_00295 [Bdellovibrionaceae bacterium]|nr:hypothetical protein [Pseudobdellovibrionaceae bacterium]
MRVSVISFLPLVVFSSLSIHCAHSEMVKREVAQSTNVPDQERWKRFKEFAANLDLTAEGTSIAISSGGTSVYAVVSRGGKPIGAVLPENAATSLSGEVLTFHLAKILGYADIYQPGTYKLLTGANLRAFSEIIPKSPYEGKVYANKELNRVAILERIQRSPNGIDAIYKDWANRPYDYDGLSNWKINSFDKSHILKGSKTPFASFLTCAGPLPAKDVVVNMNKGTTNEFDAARELSTIFLIDALTQQWDRFSGGNLQTITVDGKVHFGAYDNGGTWGGTRWTSKYTELVSRFDRDAAQRLMDMNKFLNEGSGGFMGLRTEAELMQVLGVTKLPGTFKKFKESLKMVSAHIIKNQNCYFE